MRHDIQQETLKDPTPDPDFAVEDITVDLEDNPINA